MKKLFLLLMSLCALGAHADEGMWTLYNLSTAIYQQMQQEGFQLPMEQLYQSDNAIKNQVSSCRPTDWSSPTTTAASTLSAATLP